MQSQANNTNTANTMNGRFVPLISLLVVSGIIFISDRITKSMVVNNLVEGEIWAPFPSISRIFKINYITNSGAAFGLFANGNEDGGSSSGIVFIIIAIIVAAAIIYYYPMVKNTWVRLALGLQLGGALGNLWDRIFNNGHVIDFADLGFWPIFNIADISIVIGVTILAIWLWQQDDDLTLNPKLPLSSDAQT